MKPLAPALVALALLGSAGTVQAGEEPETKPAAAESGIAWQKDYDAAKAQAAKEKKGLLVYLTPDWFA